MSLSCQLCFPFSYLRLLILTSDIYMFLTGVTRQHLIVELLQLLTSFAINNIITIAKTRTPELSSYVNEPLIFRRLVSIHLPCT